MERRREGGSRRMRSGGWRRERGEGRAGERGEGGCGGRRGSAWDVEATTDGEGGGLGG